MRIIFCIIFLSSLSTATYSAENKAYRIQGHIGSNFLSMLESDLKRVYFKTKKTQRRRASKFNIPEITMLIKGQPHLPETDKTYLLEIFKYISRLGITILELSGPGGDIKNAFGLGLLIKNLKLDTVVPKGKLCASACSYLYLQGQTKTMLEGSSLMFHLGVIYQGDNQFKLKKCHAFDYEKCELSAYAQLVLENYRRFINSLPEMIRKDVMSHKDRYVDRNEAQKFRITGKAEKIYSSFK